MGKSNLATILTFLSIVAILLGLWGYNSLPQLFSDINTPKSVPFDITLTPEYFNEGNFGYSDNFPISITIAKKEGRNITYLELSKENFKISRKDSGLNKPVAQQLSWDYNYNSLDIISYGYENPALTSSSSSSFPLSAKGNLQGCPNCFVGASYPYIFTLTIYYRENGGETKHESFEQIVPIK
jgi:hypothetical protein